MNPNPVLRGVGIVTILALLPALASAQPGSSGQRMDDGTNDYVDTAPGPPLHDWNVLQVPGVGRGTVLGSLFAEPEGGFYVWTNETIILTPVIPLGGRRVADPDNPWPPPGEGNPPSFTTTNGTLMHFDGAGWTTALAVEAEAGVSVFGVAPDQVYAATNTADGTVHLYRYSGNKWRREHLPDGVTGPAGTITGDQTRMFFRAGNAILVGHGSHWTVAYSNDLLVPGSEIVFLNRNQVVAPGRHGQAVWNGLAWTWQPATRSVDMNGAWGGRDAAGELHLFATGSDLQCSGTCIWQFHEDDAGTLCGCYDHVFTAPQGGGPMTGYGVDVWGSGVHDVYAVATNYGCGCLFRFNGVAWQHLVPIEDMTVPSGLDGTPRGDLYIALEDGRVLQGVRKQPLEVERELPLIEAPNPFTPGNTVTVLRDGPRSHVIEFNVPEPGAVSVEVFNIAGRHVATLEHGQRPAGVQRVGWKAPDVPVGIYFCRVRVPGLSGSARIVVER